MGRRVARGSAAWAVSLFVIAGITQYAGAALAVGLFAQIGAVGVGWWRLTLAAAVMLAWRRPWRHRFSLARAVLFGVVLGVMNTLFYLSISTIPLATAVTVEYVGPVVLAALRGRGLHTRAALGCAALGVFLISGFSIDWSQPSSARGLLFAALAGAMWALYIVIGQRVAVAANPLDSLSVALAAGAVAIAPWALLTHEGDIRVLEPLQLAALLAVAVFSSVIPYGIDQALLGKLKPEIFAILLALLPSTALLMGVIMLHQMPTPVEVAGLVSVSVAVLLANRPD